MTTLRALTFAIAAAALAACGGPDGAPPNDPGAAPADGATIARGGGGGADPIFVTTTNNPLPSTPPAPDIALRESFGFGVAPDYVRPAGGKGVLKSTLYTGLGGFWVEYPGGAATAWSAAEQGWQFAACSDDPWELPSPIQTFNGCTVSPWRDGVVKFPSALVPFRGLAGPYELSAELYPGVLPGAYVAMGLSASGATAANLQAAGQLWVALRQGPALDGIGGEWELRAGGVGGTLLASGPMVLQGYNRVALRYDPIAGTVSATVNDVSVGPFAAPGVAPRQVVLEGQGVVDNLVVRALP